MSQHTGYLEAIISFKEGYREGTKFYTFTLCEGLVV
jgi:hypothetical protein